LCTCVSRAFVSFGIRVSAIRAGYRSAPGKEKMEMAQCEVCGNEYDKAFQVSMPGEGTSTFDSFECAIHALAPTCEYCSVKVIGHGVEADGHFYCCAHCASMAGAEGVADRA
jgi:hypothetical protein